MPPIDAAGVNYHDLDSFKVEAARAAAGTIKFLRSGWRELEWTRGESAYALQHANGMVLAVAIEGLGTKNLVAENEALCRVVKDGHKSIGECNVAMAVNDLITIGALPLVYMLHPAVAQAEYLQGSNGAGLVSGTLAAMKQCSTVWGPGETPELKGIIQPGTMCLSGAVVGIMESDEFLINPANISRGDEIIMLQSSGIHANGLTRAREIAQKLSGGYLAEMPSGMTFGEALLKPTTLYVPFMEECQKRKVRISYAINMTGHGWRKIMRATQPFTYRITQLPKPHEVFRFMQDVGKISNEEAYKAFNMGGGFAVIVRRAEVKEVFEAAFNAGIHAIRVGEVEDGPRQVIIEPLGLTFDELSIR